MNTVEQAPRLKAMPDFGMEAFGINEAFQEAYQVIASDAELAVEEKIRRMENIVNEATSEIYRGFVNFRQLTVKMEMSCNDDHTLQQSMNKSDTLSTFMDDHKAEDGHDGHDAHDDKQDHKKDDDEYEIDPITGKKRKKRGWFDIYV